MGSESNPVSALRELAVRQGVEPTDEDLEAVARFLDGIVPELEELERLLPEGTTPS
jgi:hypothetical protein